MGAKDWVKATGIEMPQCKMQGCCCRGASPSVPFHQLLEKAANGDTFAQNFFSIFVPYNSIEHAKAVEAGLVERTLKASQKDENFQSQDDVVFYKCRYIGDDNKCQVWEDRPDLCRAYPDSPFLVFAPGCAFEPWAKATKEKFSEMKAEIEELKALKAQLSQSNSNMHEIDPNGFATDNRDSLSLVLSLTPQYLVSPLYSQLA